MAEMSVSLPDALKDWVEDRAREGHFSDAGDYVRELIRREREKADAIAELEALIDEGFESGISDKSFDEIIAEARAEAEARGIV